MPRASLSSYTSWSRSVTHERRPSAHGTHICNFRMLFPMTRWSRTRRANRPGARLGSDAKAALVRLVRAKRADQEAGYVQAARGTPPSSRALSGWRAGSQSVPHPLTPAPLIRPRVGQTYAEIVSTKHFALAGGAGADRKGRVSPHRVPAPSMQISLTDFTGRTRIRVALRTRSSAP
jgi:hypothetical protein